MGEVFLLQFDIQGLKDHSGRANPSTEKLVSGSFFLHNAVYNAVFTSLQKSLHF